METETVEPNIIEACNKFDMAFFEDKLKEIDEYFSSRKLWPHVKDGEDLRIECHVRPFVLKCIKHLQNPELLDN